MNMYIILNTYIRTILVIKRNNQLQTIIINQIAMITTIIYQNNNGNMIITVI